MLQKTVRILMITHNRAEYTRLSLGRLCDTAPAQAAITVWDNASDEKTRRVLQSFARHPRVEQIVYHDANARQIEPTNWFWRQCPDAAFVSKVDDDCLMPEKWCETLEKAHADIPAAGVLGCWRFFPEDFLEAVARRKIATFGAHRIMRNCWVEGSGYLMKREVIDRLGEMGAGESFTSYCIRAAAAGFINGWYYPFLFQEHMDDPRAAHSGMKSERDFQCLKPVSATTFNIENLEAWTNRLRNSARKLQMYSYDPADWIGLRAKVRRRVCKFLGRDYIPPVAARNADPGR